MKDYREWYRSNIMRMSMEKAVCVLNKPISELEMSARAKNILRRLGCITLLDVIRLDAETLVKSRGCGAGVLREITEQLREAGHSPHRIEHYIPVIERRKRKNL